MYLGIQNGKIKFYTEQSLDAKLYSLDEIRETDEEYVLDGEEYVLNDDAYKAKQAKLERERLDLLTLTPADVERALYKAKGMDFEDLKALIAEKLPDIDTKALSIEFRAKDFYRGVDFNGVRLFDAVGALLGYTPDDMDYLFENKELPVKETNEDTTNTTDIHDEPDTKETATGKQFVDTNADTATEQDVENTGSTDEQQEVLQADESV